MDNISQFKKGSSIPLAVVFEDLNEFSNKMKQEGKTDQFLFVRSKAKELLQDFFEFHKIKSLSDLDDSFPLVTLRLQLRAFIDEDIEDASIQLINAMLGIGLAKECISSEIAELWASVTTKKWWEDHPKQL